MQRGLGLGFYQGQVVNISIIVELSIKQNFDWNCV